MEGRTSDGVESKGGGREGCSCGAEVALRVIAMVLTLTAALVVALTKETTTVSVAVLHDFSIPFPLTAKFSNVSAFIYLVVANSVASAVAALSLIVGKRRGAPNGALLKAAGDLVAVALLFSAIGAGGGVGVIAYMGNSHLMWDSVQPLRQVLRRHVGFGLALFVASVSFMLLVLLALTNLPRK